MENAKIPEGGLYALLYMFYAITILFTIQRLAYIAKQDAWLAAALAVVAAFLVVLVSFVVMRPPTDDMSVPEWIDVLCGPVAGSIVNFLYFTFFLLIGATVMRCYVEIVGVAALPLTPRGILLALMIIPSAIAARLGIEVISRTAQIYLVLNLISALIVVIGVIPGADFTELLPVLASGIHPVWQAAIPSLAVLSLIMAGMWCAPYMRSGRELTNAVGWSLVTVGGLVIAVTVLAQTLFTYRGVQQMLFPVLTLTRSIQIGRVVERLDVVLIGPWFLAVFLLTAYFIYLAATQLAWLGRTRHYRPFVLPLAAGMGAAALIIVRSDAQLAEFFTIGSFPLYILVHTLVIPLILLVTRLTRQPQVTQGGRGKR